MTKHILLIDDNPDDLEFYANILNHLDEEYQIHTAESYDEAIPLFNSHDIYCTFIDYNLPEMNGIKILEKLNDLANGKVLAVVILTGEPHQTIQAEAARRGALDYIVKGMATTPEQLEAVISKTVDWAENLNKKQLGLV